MRQVPKAMAAKLVASADGLVTSWDDVRMDDIASTSGVPRATLYYYFSSKEDVLAFLLHQLLDALTDAVAEADRPDQPVPDRLAAVVRSQLSHLGESPAVAQLLVSNLGKAGKLPDIAAAINAAFHEPVRRLLVLGAEDGSLRAVDPELAATALYGAVTVVGLRCLVIEGSIDVDRVTAQLLPMFWAGLRPEAT
jgi:TetR/AcrR family transcriptional regulator